MRSFVVLHEVGAEGLHENLVTRRKGQIVPAIVDASLPHLADDRVHYPRLEQGVAVVALHVVDDSDVEAVCLTDTEVDHTWLIKTFQDGFGLV